MTTLMKTPRAATEGRFAMGYFTLVGGKSSSTVDFRTVTYEVSE